MILNIESIKELYYNFSYDINGSEAKELLEALEGEILTENNLIYFIEEIRE